MWMARSGLASNITTNIMKDNNNSTERNKAVVPLFQSILQDSPQSIHIYIYRNPLAAGSNIGTRHHIQLVVPLMMNMTCSNANPNGKAGRTNQYKTANDAIASVGTVPPCPARGRVPWASHKRTN